MTMTMQNPKVRAKAQRARRIARKNKDRYAKHYCG